MGVGLGFRGSGRFRVWGFGGLRVQGVLAQRSLKCCGGCSRSSVSVFKLT